MVLSILIPTVPGRESLLSRLLWTLGQQLNKNVEILICGGWEPFGDKVNKMRRLATGEYSVVVDDDDDLTAHYVKTALPQLKQVDYLDYGVLHLHDGKFEKIIYSEGRVHHKCIIRNELAKRVPLGNGYTDDWKWSKNIAELVKSERTIRECLYIYDFYSTGSVGTEPTGKNESTQRDVGYYPYDKKNFTWL